MNAAIVYWSGTGNTEAMAEAVAKGVRTAGASAQLIACADFDSAMVDRFDAFAFGCPAMGAEALEDGEFEPMFASVEDKLASKRVGLFGSYGWGDGEWMRTWEARCAANGITLAGESVICNEAPDDAAVAQCAALGAALV